MNNPPVTRNPPLNLIPSIVGYGDVRGRKNYSPMVFAGSGAVPDNAVPNFDLSRFVWLNGTKVFVYSPVSIKIVDQPAGANLFRQYLMIRNDDAADTLFVDFGQNASALSGVSLLPGEIIAYDAVVPQDDVYVFGAVGGNVSVLYGNITIPGA